MCYLLLHKFGFKIVGPIENDQVSKAEKFFYQQGFKVFRAGKPPSQKQLDRWESKGYARCVDGCFTKGLESCRHGARSWLAVFKGSKVNS